MDAEVCAGRAALGATCRSLLLIGELDRGSARALGLRVDGAVAVVEVQARCGSPPTRPSSPSSSSAAVICDRSPSGVLSYSKVRALIRIATPATEAKLVKFAESPPPRGSSAHPHLRTSSVNPDTTMHMPHQRRNRPSRRRRHRHHRGSLPRDGAETVLDAMKQAMTEVPADPPTIPRITTRDALELVPRLPRRRHVTTTTETVVTPTPSSSPIPTITVLERLICDTSLRLIVREPDGTLRYRHRHRLSRRAAPYARPKRPSCRFPAAPADRTTIFITSCRSSGRPHNIDDCLTLCAFHHRLVHEAGWRIHGDSAESPNLTFVGPHGRTVDGSTTPPPTPVP